MSETLPPDLQKLVRQVVANGEFATEDDVVIAGVRALQELKARHNALRQDIQVAIEELDRGEGEPLDMDSIKAEVAEQYRQVHAWEGRGGGLSPAGFSPSP